MSLRRSARVATSSTSNTTDTNGTNGTSSTKTASKPAPASKKRKPKTNPSPPSPTTKDEPNDFAIPNPPSTPLPKKRKPAPAPSPSHILDLPLPTLSRPADPHTTNAPLSTPNGSRVVAYSSSPIKPSDPSPVKRRKAKEVVPPDVGTLRSATTNIDTLLEDAETFLVSVDPKLKGLVEKHKCTTFSPEGLREVVEPFEKLASGIIGQQVSGAAAASIRAKFTALFADTHPSFPSPAQVIAKDLATLRTAGLSQRKAEYISGLAEKFHSGELSAQMLVSASDEELIEKLVAVRGLGRWSVEMFACFGLKRMDVFSTGDLGVQRGMATYIGRNTSKLKSKGGKWKYMTEQEMLDLASKFSPYRSLFMWYMWRIEDVDISVLQQ
ncbi:DNA-3-methyladenine glycosylase [Paraphoma chrysanthemicola]|nr:DNA-3-methyladenine glycosylase [Paraphoma chrysanthemicola]